jgi:hypothetical protein
MSANIWDQRSLKVLAVLVLLLAGPVLWSWTSPVGQTLSIPEPIEKSIRNLASVASTEATDDRKSGKLGRPVTVQWNLSSAPFVKEIDGTHVRIKGLLKGFKTESILNETNGFTASIFLTGNEFTTDFIELKEGLNLIQVDLTDAKGQKVTKKIEVTRRAPASTTGD